jgi:hypothetical protein
MRMGHRVAHAKMRFQTHTLESAPCDIVSNQLQCVANGVEFFRTG